MNRIHASWLAVALACSGPRADDSETACRGARAPCGGTLLVPLDRSGARDGAVEVAFRFIPARGGPTTETIVYLAGGPGYAARPDEPLVVDLLGPALDARNLLVFDYRGVGGSAPLVCPGLPDPTTLDLDARPTAADIAACVERLADVGVEHFGTVAAMDDLEDLRRALGLAPLHLFGVSYGVFAAEVFAVRHRGSVGSIAFHAGPLASDRRSSAIWWLPLVSRPLEGMDAACARIDCGLGPVSASDLWRQAVERVRAGAAPGLSLADAVNLHRHATGDATILALIKATRTFVADGDATALLGLATALRPEPESDGPPAFDPDASNALSMQVFCNDFPMPHDPASAPDLRRQQLAAAWAALPTSTFDPFTKDEWMQLQAPLATLCTDWTPRTALSVTAAPAAVSAPILFIAPELDGTATDAGFVRRAYPDATILELELGSHGGAFESTCARDELRRFLTDGALSTTRCAADSP